VRQIWLNFWDTVYNITSHSAYKFTHLQLTKLKYAHKQEPE